MTHGHEPGSGDPAPVRQGAGLGPFDDSHAHPGAPVYPGAAPLDSNSSDTTTFERIGDRGSTDHAGSRNSSPLRTAVRPPLDTARPPLPPPGSTVLTPPRAGTSRRPAARRARLTLTRIDPWSVLKAALVFTTCLLVVWMIAVIVLYGILTGAGVFDSINNNLSDALGTKINFNGAFILGGAAILGAFNVVLLSALATVAAFAYNVTAGLVGGLDVTLAERE